MLSPSARKILEITEMSEELNHQQVAQATKLSVDHVSRLRSQMREQGILQPRVFINTPGFGYLDMKIFFSPQGSSRQKREKLIQMLSRYPGVAWIGSYAGDYRMGVTFYCRSPLELREFMDVLSTRLGTQLSTRSVLTRCCYQWFGHSFGKPRRKPKVFSIETFESSRQPDDTDARILGLLGSMPYLGLRDLARQLGESSSTIARRVARLEEEKIIQGYYTSVASETLGLETYRVLLSFNSLNPQRRQALKSWTYNHPDATFLAESIGAWDFELGFELQRSRELDPICDELQELCGSSLRDIRILTEIQEWHINFFPFSKELNRS